MAKQRTSRMAGNFRKAEHGSTDARTSQGISPGEERASSSNKNWSAARRLADEDRKVVSPEALEHAGRSARNIRCGGGGDRAVCPQLPPAIWAAHRATESRAPVGHEFTVHAAVRRGDRHGPLQPGPDGASHPPPRSLTPTARDRREPGLNRIACAKRGTGFQPCA